jgi:hypothetical protein
MNLDISREEKRRLSSQTRKDKKRKAKGLLTVDVLVKEEPPVISCFDLEKRYEQQKDYEVLENSEKKVPLPYSQKAFDLGEPILKHHSSGLIGEFPHKILY